MKLRQAQRNEGSYTLFTGTLTEEEQQYRDYFETDLQNSPEDEIVEENLDRELLLGKSRYNLNRFDFQESYVGGNEDDQTSFVEKKIFKFKYRRALDTFEDYTRRNKRMIENQKKRFNEDNTNKLIEAYLEDPATYEADYLEMVQKESALLYNDYFESDKEEKGELAGLLEANPALLVSIFENHQLHKRDRSSYISCTSYVYI